MITHALPITKVDWTIPNRSPSSTKTKGTRKLNKFKSKSKPKHYYSTTAIPLSKDFLYRRLTNTSKHFNFCVSWNINGWTDDKRDSIMYFNSIFKPICLCLQEADVSENTSIPNRSSSDQHPDLPHYHTCFKKTNLVISGMRSLYIGIHRSYSFLQDTIDSQYILSIKIISFWGVKCTIGNVYIPTSAHQTIRSKVLKDVKDWLNSEDHLTSPTFLVGSFNMSKEQLVHFVSKQAPHYHVMDITGHPTTWSNGGRSSCIDHIVYNDPMKNYLNKLSVCTSFNDVSSHSPLVLSCHKDSSDGFVTPVRTIRRWSSQVCKDRKKDIISHNAFTLLLNEFKATEERSTADNMVLQFINTANQVGHDINAIPSLKRTSTTTTTSTNTTTTTFNSTTTSTNTTTTTSNNTTPSNSSTTLSNSTRSHTTRSHPTTSHITKSHPTKSRSTRSHPTRSRTIKSHPTTSNPTTSHSTTSHSTTSHSTTSHSTTSHSTTSHSTTSHSTTSNPTTSNSTRTHSTRTARSRITRSRIIRSRITRFHIARSCIARSYIARSRIARSRIARSRIARSRIARSLARSRIARSRTARSRTAEFCTARSRTAGSRTARSRTARSRTARSRTARSRKARSRKARSHPARSHGTSLYCPQYIKKLSLAKSKAYQQLKDSEFTHLDDQSDLITKYRELCDRCKAIKSNLRKNRFHRTLIEVCSDFIQGDPRKAWDGLKKLTESFSSSSTINSSSSNVLKDRNGKLLCTPQDLVDRFGEHYEALASDITDHSLDQQYWQECLGPTTS